jgi:NADH-quinone oxidoreductase subunit A
MTALAGTLLVFTVIAIGFVAVNLTLGQLFRPQRPGAEKSTVYECGEPAIGSARVQFDLRFYVVALLFVIFDVEVAFFFPWAVVFGTANRLADPALVESERALLADAAAGLPADPAVASSLAWLAFVDILIFFGVLLVGFAYLWRRGDLDWVRSLAAQARPTASGGN